MVNALILMSQLLCADHDEVIAHEMQWLQVLEIANSNQEGAATKLVEISKTTSEAGELASAILKVWSHDTNDYVLDYPLPLDSTVAELQKRLGGGRWAFSLEVSSEGKLIALALSRGPEGAKLDAGTAEKIKRTARFVPARSAGQYRSAKMVLHIRPEVIRK